MTSSQMRHPKVLMYDEAAGRDVHDDPPRQRPLLENAVRDLPRSRPTITRQ